MPSAGSASPGAKPSPEPPHRIGRQRGAQVGLELPLGRTDLLEVEDVEEAVAHDRPQELGGSGGPERERHADAGDGPHPLGVQPGQVPDDQRAPVVPHEHGLVVAGLVDEAEQVVAERVDPVRPDLGRAAGAAVAALVRGDDVVAGGGEGRELVAPRPRRLGEAVGEDDRRRGRIAGLQHGQLDAVDGRDAVPDRLGHRRPVRLRPTSSRWRRGRTGPTAPPTTGRRPTRSRRRTRRPGR